MDEWVVAIILIGISLMVAAGLVGACRMLGGWTFLYAFVTGNKEERVNLATHEELNGYAVYPPNFVDRTGVTNRPPLGEPQLTFSKGLKSDVVQGFRPVNNNNNGSPPVTSTVVPDPLPPPPNDPHPRKFSIDAIRRASIDPAELPDVLTMEGGSARLQRAMSCDSVCSDTSVILEALDSPQKCGEIELKLEYSSEELHVTVIRARGLTSNDCLANLLDTFVRVGVQNDQSTTKKTQVQRGTDHPEYNETFLFGIEGSMSQKVLLCSVYSCDRHSNNVLGDTEIKLDELDLKTAHRAWLPIVDHQRANKGYGELLFSLSYLPTAERLTVVLVKARNLVWSEGKQSADPFVKVYLLQKGKKISKKKTSIKKGDRNPTFNEAMIFSVPAAALQNIQLRLTMAEYHSDGKTPSVGHVFAGPQCTGKQLSHWNQMISSPRKPIAMWHPLRQRDKC